MGSSTGDPRASAGGAGSTRGARIAALGVPIVLLGAGILLAWLHTLPLVDEQEAARAIATARRLLSDPPRPEGEPAEDILTTETLEWSCGRSDFDADGCAEVERLLLRAWVRERIGQGFQPLLLARVVEDIVTWSIETGEAGSGARTALRALWAVDGSMNGPPLRGRAAAGATSARARLIDLVALALATGTVSAADLDALDEMLTRVIAHAPAPARALHHRFLDPAIIERPIGDLTQRDVGRTWVCSLEQVQLAEQVRGLGCDSHRPRECLTAIEGLRTAELAAHAAPTPFWAAWLGPRADRRRIAACVPYLEAFPPELRREVAADLRVRALRTAIAYARADRRCSAITADAMPSYEGAPLPRTASTTELRIEPPPWLGSSVGPLLSVPCVAEAPAAPGSSVR